MAVLHALTLTRIDAELRASAARRHDNAARERDFDALLDRRFDALAQQLLAEAAPKNGDI